MIHVLVTREAKNGKKTCNLLQNMGFFPVLCPFIEIESLEVDLKDYDPDYIIITSINAAKALPFSKIPCLVVGQKSAAYLSKKGFEMAGAFPDSEALLASISAKKFHACKFLYLSGDHIAMDIPKRLERMGHKLVRKVVYKSKIVENINVNVLDAIDVVAFYSPRTALAFSNFISSNSMHNKLKNIIAVCLSARIAANLKSLNFKKVLTAPEPTEAALLKLLKK
jgi:uroporphyrinogen-III synthase